MAPDPVTSVTPSCTVPPDEGGFHELYNGDTPINPIGKQVIYYKTGVGDYNSVRPFPKGLRFVVGNAKNTDSDKLRKATEAGWECDRTDDFPTFCTAAGYEALSC